MREEEIFQIIRLNNNSKIKELINSKTIKLLGENHQSLLQEAIAFENTEMALFLIEQKIDFNNQDFEGSTALHYAIEHNQFSITKMILENNANVNIQDIRGNSPLWTATFNSRGNYVFVKLLLEFRANTKLKNKYGLTPIDFAKRIEDIGLIEVLDLE
jgi:ankyrin repeat protein